MLLRRHKSHVQNAGVNIPPAFPEFDKFLEERAKAAEMMPSLPSAGDPAPPVHMTSGGRKKTGVHEDTLFAV